MQVMGCPDDLKLRSCMTLFSCAQTDGETVFDDVLEKYYGGRKDDKALQLLDRNLH